MDENFFARLKLEDLEKWKGWHDKIPFLKFPSDWEVKIIPPFAGAMCRFIVKKGDREISAYLDVFHRLGFADGPYWEIYPYEGDTFRCGISEVDTLIDAIRIALDSEIYDS